MVALDERPERSAHRAIDAALDELAAHADRWAAMPIPRMLQLLDTVRAATDRVAARWVEAATRAKGIPEGSPLVGEEWSSGPWALLAGVDHLSRTLRALHEGTDPLQGAKVRQRPDGQVIVEVHPADVFEDLLLNGVRAEVWMQPGVTPANLRDTMAVRFKQDREGTGKVALVLGAGNIASIAPLDVLYELVVKGCVCILKMNPVNDYLGPFLEEVFDAFVQRGFVRFAYGGVDVGQYLTAHDRVDEIHVTGAESTYDAIVFGGGPEGEARRRRDEPITTKRVTAELGGVGPTLVVPGPWSEADVAFQAEHIATQKMHNGGFNCIAAQVLVMPRGWEWAEPLLQGVEKTLRELEPRVPYYPGAADRVDAVRRAYPRAEGLDPGDAAPTRLLVRDVEAERGEGEPAFRTEFFCGALAQTWLDADSPEGFLRRAIAFANESCHGTLGANLIIHPATVEALGPVFEDLIAELRYGTIGINAWSGVGFLLARAAWGAHPGHTRTAIGSGRGVVHNALMFDRPQKTVVRAPFAPFPRSLRTGERTILPKPPWFVTNRTADEVMRRVTRFAADPGWKHLPAIFAAALRG
jgi:aldehyde dehydrogenase (NAD(P)+)